MWIKNTEGKKDAVLTMTLMGFIVILLKVALSGVTVTLLESSFSFGSVDALVVAAVLTPTLGAYVARRHTDKKFESGLVGEEAQPSERNPEEGGAM